VTFRDLQDLANETIFDAAQFGESVTYTPPTPPGGAPVVIQAVFGQVELVALDDVSTIAPVLDVRVADLSAGPLTGATVVVRSVSYKVTNVQGPDDSGVARLLLMLSSVPS